MSILAWFDDQLQLRKGEHIKILRGILEGNKIRATMVENLTSGVMTKSRIEGVMMTNPPRDISPVIEGIVEKVTQNANATHFELKEIEDNNKIKFNIFISYDSDNVDVAKYFDDCCKAWGLSSFLAMRTLEPGENFIDNLKEGLDSSDYIVPIFTFEATQSQWVNQEVGYAVKIGKDLKNKIHPIRCEGVSIEGFIRNIHATNYATNWEKTFGKFFDFANRKLHDDIDPITIRCITCGEQFHSDIPELDEIKRLRDASGYVEVHCPSCSEKINLSPFTLLPKELAIPPAYQLPTGEDIPHNVQLLHTNDLKQLLAEWREQIPYPMAAPQCPNGLLPVIRNQSWPELVECANSLEVEERVLFPDLNNHIQDMSVLDDWIQYKDIFGKFEKLKQENHNIILEKAESFFQLSIDNFPDNESLTPESINFIYNFIIEKIQRGESEARTRLAWDRMVEPTGDFIDFRVGASSMIRINNTEDRQEIWQKWDLFFDELIKDEELESRFQEVLKSMQNIEELRLKIIRLIDELISYPILKGTCKYLE